MLLLPPAGALSYVVPFPINYMPSASLVLKWFLLRSKKHFTSGLSVSFFFYDRFDLICILAKWQAYIIINMAGKWKGLTDKLSAAK